MTPLTIVAAILVIRQAVHRAAQCHGPLRRAGEDLRRRGRGAGHHGAEAGHGGGQAGRRRPDQAITDGIGPPDPNSRN